MNIRPPSIIIDFFGSTAHFSIQLQKTFCTVENSKYKLIMKTPGAKKRGHRLMEILSIAYNYIYLFVLIIKCRSGQLFIFNIPGIPCVELLFLKLIKWRKGVSISILHNETPSHGESRLFRNYRYDSYYKNSNIVILHDSHASSLYKENGFYIEFPGYVPCSKQVENLNLNSNILKLGFFGNIRPYKNIESLLIELKTLDKSVLEKVSLIISGKIFYNVIEVIDNINKLELSEFNFNSTQLSDSEFEKLISGCDFLLLPYSDSSGSAILSLSASLGVPVIVNNVGIFSNFIDKYDNGIKYDCAQIGELAKVIDRLVADKNLKSVYKNKARAAQLLIPTWEEYVNKIQKSAIKS